MDGLREQRIYLALTLGLVGAAGLTGLWFFHRDPLYASPWEHRTDVERLYLQSWKSYVAGQAAEPGAVAPEAVAFPSIQVLHYPNGDLINFRRGEGSAAGDAGARVAVWADGEGRAVLPGGAELRLLACALSVPRPDDPWGEEEDEEESLVFRRARGSGEIVPEEELDEWGVPAEVRRVSRAARWFPMVRKIFVVKGEGVVSNGDWKVFDSQSRALVTQAAERRETGDERLWVLDTDLSIWHDTPLLAVLELGCGAPERRSLAMENGAQVAFGKEGRLQLLTMLGGRLESVRAGPDFRYLIADRDQPGTTLAYRVQPVGEEARYLLRARSGAEWERLPLRKGTVGWSLSRFAREEIEELEVEFLPERARVFFPLPGVGRGMPNGRGIRNLFDVKIPRFSIPEMEGGGERVAYVLLNVVTGATMSEVNQWTSSLQVTLPEDYLPRQFIDTSPREVLQEYLRATGDSYVRLDRDGMELVFHRPEPWRVRWAQWWHQRTGVWWER